MPNSLELPENDWQRVSPKLVIAEFIGMGAMALIALAGSVVFFMFSIFIPAWIFAAGLAGMLIAAPFVPRRIRAIGYQLRDDDLLFRRGILFQRFVAVPYGRMQLIDINRGPLVRALGLSELKFVTAASATGVSIPGLPEDEAVELRDRLVALAETRRAGL